MKPNIRQVLHLILSSIVLAVITPTSQVMAQSLINQRQQSWIMAANKASSSTDSALIMSRRNSNNHNSMPDWQWRRKKIMYK